MSGFSFHLRCGACGLVSRSSYPDHYDRVVRPEYLVLPAAREAEALALGRAAFARGGLDGVRVHDDPAAHAAAAARHARAYTRGDDISSAAVSSSPTPPPAATS